MEKLLPLGNAIRVSMTIPSSTRLMMATAQKKAKKSGLKINWSAVASEACRAYAEEYLKESK